MFDLLLFKNNLRLGLPYSFLGGKQVFNRRENVDGGVVDDFEGNIELLSKLSVLLALLRKIRSFHLQNWSGHLVQCPLNRLQNRQLEGICFHLEVVFEQLVLLERQGLDSFKHEDLLKSLNCRARDRWHTRLRRKLRHCHPISKDPMLWSSLQALETYALLLLRASYWPNNGS